MPAGLHHIDAQYQSQRLRGYLLIAGLLILPLLALAEWRRDDLARLSRRVRRGFEGAAKAQTRLGGTAARRTRGRGELGR